MHPRLVAALHEQLARRQAALDAGARAIGWKIGGGIPEVDELTGGEPTIGYLTTATQLEPGGEYSGTGDGALHADTEVVLELGAGETIAGLRTGLELVDLGRQADDLEEIVADNVLHRAFAVGPTVPVGGATEARSLVNGELRRRGRSAGDYARTVRIVAQQLDVLGERLRVGDLIFAGSVTQVPLEPGDEVAAEIDGLGRVSLRISPAAAPPAIAAV
jgi:2-keto-4-pentenoate hydratase